MSNCHSSDGRSKSRRDFLRVSLALPVAASGAAAFAQAVAADAPPAKTPDSASPEKAPLPKRKLGRSGIDVCILAQGGDVSAHSPQFLDQAWSMGIRYFDTADCYLSGKSERNVGEWLKKYPERRKDLFLVTKDHPRVSPSQMPALLDKRLANIGATDYVDAFYIHGIQVREYKQASLEWPKSDEFKKTAEAIRKSGKAKLVGLSTHDNENVPVYMKAAAEGGFVDIIMFAYDPILKPTDELNRAIDACHKAGIGLVAMKTQRAWSQVPARLPELDKLGLTVPQGVIQAVLSDERISATCSAISNLQQMAENIEAARKFEGPLKQAHLDVLREAIVAAGPTMCPNCDGSCARAAGNEQLALADIARLVNYYERDGNTEAREWYQSLAASARNAGGADLAAASRACLSKLDFAKVIGKAERYFA